MTWMSWCFARKKPSHALLVDDVCWPAINRPISMPAISSSFRCRPLLTPASATWIDWANNLRPTHRPISMPAISSSFKCRPLLTPASATWIDWAMNLRPTWHKTGHFGDVLPSQSLGLILKNYYKHNKSKHASVTKYTTTSNEPQKTTARFSRLLQPPAWKWRGPVLVSALHKFVTYLLKQLPTYLQPRDPHGAHHIPTTTTTHLFSQAFSHTPTDH